MRRAGARIEALTGKALGIGEEELAEVRLDHVHSAQKRRRRSDGRFHVDYYVRPSTRPRQGPRTRYRAGADGGDPPRRRAPGFMSRTRSSAGGGSCPGYEGRPGFIATISYSDDDVGGDFLQSSTSSSATARSSRSQVEDIDLSRLSFRFAPARATASRSSRPRRHRPPAAVDVGDQAGRSAVSELARRAMISRSAACIT